MAVLYPYIQAFLGHGGISATEIYTHVSPASLKRVYENAHPLMNKQNNKERIFY